MNAGVILLAAGGSTRLGQPKQLLTWRGEPLIRHAAKTALNAETVDVMVVLGSSAEECSQHLTDLPLHTVVNSNWRQGMGSSITTGLKALLELQPELDAVIIMLCDQPYVTASLLRGLTFEASATGSDIIASQYSSDAQGPPALFRKALFPKLLSLPPSSGAKALFSSGESELDSHSDDRDATSDSNSISCVSFPAGSKDIDTLADYMAMICPR